MLNFDNLQMSLKHLEVQFQNLNNLPENTDVLIREAVQESCIQRFEVCYDCLWKIGKRYLNHELGIPDLPNSPKPIFRLCNENNILPSSIERWLVFADARNATSHDYSGEKAVETLQEIGEYIKDAIKFYQTLTGETWE